MTGWDDDVDAMRRLPLDSDTVDRLLRGLVPPDDAPPGYAEVAGLVTAARGEMGPGRDPDVAVLARLRAARAAARPPARQKRARPPARQKRARPLAARAAAGATAGLLTLTGGLAAAGTLPAPAQEVLHRLGIDVPVAGDDRPAPSGGAPVGPAASTPGGGSSANRPVKPEPPAKPQTDVAEGPDGPPPGTHGAEVRAVAHDHGSGAEVAAVARSRRQGPPADRGPAASAAEPRGTAVAEAAREPVPNADPGRDNRGAVASADARQAHGFGTAARRRGSPF